MSFNPIHSRYRHKPSIVAERRRLMKHDIRESVKRLKRSMNQKHEVKIHEPVPFEQPAPALDPADMSRDELRLLAKAQGRRGYGKMNKADLLRLVRS